jgi:Domain of unknown function (DUF4349)
MKKFGLLVFISAVFFSGCAQSSSTPNIQSTAPYGSSSSSNATSSTQEKTAGTGSGAGRGVGSGGGGTKDVSQQVSLDQKTESQNQPALDRKIVRNADIQLEAAAPAEVMNTISSLADSKGGFVVETQSSSSEVKTTGHDTVLMTVRVPAAKFQETLDEIRKTGSRVIAENVKGEDVTEEFIDIEARLKSQKALEAQFVEIMKQAKSVDDALEVQRQLATVRGDIEKIEGRKKFLENQTSFSTIKIKLQTPAAFSTNSSGFMYQLGQAFSHGLDAALGFILVLITFLIAVLPFLIIIVLPIYLVIRYLLKKGSRVKAASDVARDEIRGD